MTTAPLLVNLAIALGAGLIGAMIAARLKQSVILGYILAGVVIGPFTPGFVADFSAVEALADLGVIFLLFTIGIQLSLRDLLRAGWVAIGGGSLQVLAILGVGAGVGLLIGWGLLESLFFGAVLSNSSSTVLSKVLDERGELGTDYGQIGLAWSTVQDLSTIVFVVVFSALAAGSQSLVADLGWALVKAAVFLVVLVVAGSRVLPWIFGRVATFQSREIFILSVSAVTLGTAYLASLAGLSLALGAFLAGVAVGESDLSHQILGEIQPIRDILAGLFFVLVGMLVDPLFIFNNVGLFVLTLLLIVVVKGALCSALAWLFRYPPRTAVMIGAVLAQSAEFSFLLARFGVDLGVISGASFNSMLAGAAASIVLLPILLRFMSPLAVKLEQALPESAMSRLPQIGDSDISLRRHAVICGFGRVGRVIAMALQRRGFSYIIIEQDQRTVRRLRDRGIPAVMGHADNPNLLNRAHIDKARALIVAVPDPLAARRIVDYARQANPNLDIVVRTHSDAELRYFEDLGVGEAVIGELELALEMARHTLRRFGVSSSEVLGILQGLRSRAAARADDEWLGLD